mgnify:CR=1 FL=1
MNFETNRKSKIYAVSSCLGCFIICFIIVGTMNTYGIFFPDMMADRGWSAAMITVSSVLSTTVTFLLGQYYGNVIRKMGIRAACSIGIFCFGFGYFIWSLVPTFWMSFVSAIFRGVGMAFAAQSTTSLVVSNWFYEKRGAVLGIVMSGVGIGGAVMSLIYGRIIAAAGWRSGFQSIFLFCILIALPAAIFLVKEAPERYSMTIDVKKTETNGTGQAAEGLTLQQARKSPAFYMLFPAMFFINIITISTAMYGAAYFTELGFSTVSASNFMSIYLTAGAIVTLVGGFAMDRLGSLRFTLICVVAAIVGVLLRHFAAISNVVMFAVSMFLIGIGSTISNQTPAAVTMELFGRRDYASIVSKYTVTVTFAAGLMSPVLGLLHTTLGSYRGVAIVAATVAAGAATLFAAAVIIGRRFQPTEVE